MKPTTKNIPDTTRTTIETTKDRRTKLNKIRYDNDMPLNDLVNIMIDKFILDCKKKETHVISTKRSIEMENSNHE